MAGYVPQWLLVPGRVRCTCCGATVARAWLCYTAPGVWQLAYCEPCAAKVAGE